MIQTSRILAMALTAAALAGACGGTDVGNPIDVDFTLYNESFDPGQGSAAADVRRGGTTVRVISGWLAVERIRLRDAATCQGDAEIEHVGPFAVDLLAPGTLPELQGIDVPASGYCRFEVRWDRFDGALPAGAPAELVDASIVLQGTRGDGTAFIVRSQRDDELRLDAVAGAFTIDQATHALFLGLDAAALFAGVDLDVAVVGPDDTIHIDDDNNPDLSTIFENNLKDAADLFDDDDGDGELDPNERADVLAE